MDSYTYEIGILVPVRSSGEAADVTGFEVAATDGHIGEAAGGIRPTAFATRQARTGGTDGNRLENAPERQRRRVPARTGSRRRVRARHPPNRYRSGRLGVAQRPWATTSVRQRAPRPQLD